MKRIVLFNKPLASVLHLLVFFSLIALITTVSAQDTPEVEEEPKELTSGIDLNRPSNSIFIEYGGHSRIYALNYERTILRPGNTRLNLRIGFGYTTEFLTSPVAAVLYIPIKQQELWLSLGATPYVKSINDDVNRDVFTNLVAGIGYRYTIPTTNWFIQASFHPILQFDPTTKYLWGEAQTGQFRPAVGAGLSF